MKQHHTKKKEIYSNLNLEGITDADYMHAKRVCEDFAITNLGEYHDFCFKSDVLLSAVFENFRKMFLKIHKLDPVKSKIDSNKIRTINRCWYVINGWKRN